jgi:hypothetical protein
MSIALNKNIINKNIILTLNLIGFKLKVGNIKREG